MTKLTEATEKYLAAAKPRAEYYRQASRPAGARRNDRNRWQRFSNYLGSKDPWDATEEDIAAFCAKLSSNGLSHLTIAAYLNSLRYTYTVAGKGDLHGRPGRGTRSDDPTASDLVRSTLRGIRHVQNRSPKRKEPISLSILDELIDLQPDTIKGIRNRAIYAVGWAGALHRKEIQAMDVEAGGAGSGYVTLEGNGFVVNIHRWVGPHLGRQWSKICVPLRTNFPEHCPTGLLRDWLDIYRARNGPLFPRIDSDRIVHGQRMSRNDVRRTFKRDIAKLGLSPVDYSPRSLRRGCLEWLAEEGVPLDRVMRHAGIRTIEHISRYVRPYRAIDDSPLKLTRWHQ